MKGLPFVIRVYGIYINEHDELLVSDEYIKGQYITKFPGGGLEFGEGLVQCLIREMKEETGHDFEVIRHFYTTDFFVASAFDPSYQVVSVYYLIRPQGQLDIRTASMPFDFEELKDGAQSFRYLSLKDLKREQLTLIIDREVAGMILKKQAI